MTEPTRFTQKLAYKVPEVVELTGRHENYIYDALASGALKGSQSGPGAVWFIQPDAIRGWVSRGCPRRNPT